MDRLDQTFKLYHKTAQVFTANHMFQIQMSVGNENLLETNEYEATLIFGSSMLPFDQEGRVLIPEILRNNSSLANDALFVGMGRKFRIWEPNSFANYEQKAREYMKKRKT